MVHSHSCPQLLSCAATCGRQRSIPGHRPASHSLSSRTLTHSIAALPCHLFPCLPDPVPLSALKDHKDGEALAGWSLFSAGANLQSLHYVPQKAFDFIMDEM